MPTEPNAKHTAETARALLDQIDAEIGTQHEALDKLRSRRRRLLRRVREEGVVLYCDNCNERPAFARRNGKLLCDQCAA